jgi:cobalamin synthase
MWPAGLLAIWPLYGAALGGAGAALFISASRFLPVPAAAAVVTVFWASVSSLLREDLRIGAPHGPLTVVRIIPRTLAAFVWIGAFAHEGSSHSGVLRMALVAAAAQCISRAGALALAWTSQPAAGGLELCAHLRISAVVPAVLTGALAASTFGLRIGGALIVGAYLILRGARDWFYRQHAGIDGDDIAYARMLVECFTVLLASFAA